MQWADPVTGSSGTPSRGQKNRETKSALSPGAVTMTPRRSSRRASAAMSGAIALIWASVSKSAR